MVWGVRLVVFYNYLLKNTSQKNRRVEPITKQLEYLFGKNSIVVFTFWSYSQFDLYIFIAVNLISIIFHLKSIWSLVLTN